MTNVTLGLRLGRRYLKLGQRTHVRSEDLPSGGDSSQVGTSVAGPIRWFAPDRVRTKSTEMKPFTEEEVAVLL